MTIVTLRYLYFGPGLFDPDISSHISRSPTPTPGAREAAPSSDHDISEDLLQNISESTSDHQIEEHKEHYFDPGHLSPEAHMSDAFSRSPSPMPSPRPTDASITFNHWHRRYDIHNEATSELFYSLSALSSHEDMAYLRYALLPLMVLALISRPSSDERALCLALFERFKASMAYQSAASNPVGGSVLDFDISWTRLDAYAAETEQERREDRVFVEPQLHNSAPEWNWWFMLKHIDLKTVWPVIAGTMHLELGTEFWAFSMYPERVVKETMADNVRCTI